ncbi:putative peroxisomal membrane protein [Phaeomoniella chlamydospora]|uniref:Putative peroxisomal membrane protein n=1 Tax=Phaeomoniella chlamydospora TaxID=158046 RepID=A0A0G2E880_PHACM|nr:putative peroxisomal membrane protein [Phaeomoniella chlamydospora]
MEPIKDVATRLLLNPDLAPLLAIIKSARNGAVYGAKVRFPHALVMVFLFRSGTYVIVIPVTPKLAPVDQCLFLGFERKYH